VHIRSSNKLLRSLALLAAVSLPVAFAQDGSPVRGGTMTIIQAYSPKTLNPIIDPGGPGFQILDQVYENLTWVDREGNIIGVLATSWEQVDELTYVFHLRQGVKFHSGDEMTAEDVVFTFEELYKPDSVATFRAHFQRYMESAVALDDYTVQFNLKEPWPIFMSFLRAPATKIVNKDFVLASDGAHGTSVWDGTGPYRLVNWVVDSSLTLERFEDYWDPELPYLDRLVFRLIPEPSTQFATMETGQAQVLLDPEFTELLRYDNTPGLNVVSVPSNNTTVLSFATMKPPFNDGRVRQAIDLAVDRDMIVQIALRGRGEVAHDFFPTYHWAHDPTYQKSRDLERARQLLAEAGYTAANPLRFTLLTGNQNVFLDQAQVIQQNLAEIGIQVELLPMDYTALSAMTAAPHADWQGHAAIYRITPLRSTAWEFTNYMFYSGGSINRARYNVEGGPINERADALIEEANGLSDFVPSDQERARPLYAEAARLILDDDVPVMLLNFWHNADVISDRVQNYYLYEVDQPLFKDVWLTN
jgi:peptide/nickel transport system substrate-binding protein